MIPRTIERKIKEAGSKYPVITLTGPRQSGKTTLVRELFKDYQYVSLEDPDIEIPQDMRSTSFSIWEEPWCQLK